MLFILKYRIGGIMPHEHILEAPDQETAQKWAKLWMESRSKPLSVALGVEPQGAHLEPFGEEVVRVTKIIGPKLTDVEVTEELIRSVIV